MPRTRPPYPEQFRREAVELVRKHDRSIKEIASDLGVTEQSSRCATGSSNRRSMRVARAA
jgi:transposase